MDRLTSMAVFTKAAELGSFAAAAGALRMSPQLIGKHVQTLEDQLGVRLLHRTTRRQHLTDAGVRYYEKVKLILAQVADADELAAEEKSAPRGRLRIDAPVTFGVHVLMPRLVEYMNRYPEIQVELSLSNRYVDAVGEGIDVVFRVGELSDSSRVARVLAPYQLVLCAAPAYLSAHPAIKAPQDLARHECLNFSHTELRTHWTLAGVATTDTVPVASRLTVDSGEALLVAALAGMGILLQPMELVEAAMAEGKLVRVLPKHAPLNRPLHLLYAPDKQMTPKLRSFIEFAVAAFSIDSKLNR